MSIKANDFDHIVTKLKLKVRNSGDRLVWFEYNGKIITRTRRSRKKGRDLPFQHSIRTQLKLNENEFRSAIKCNLSRNDYIKILKGKGII